MFQMLNYQTLEVNTPKDPNHSLMKSVTFKSLQVELIKSKTTVYFSFLHTKRCGDLKVIHCLRSFDLMIQTHCIM